jgi:hypothetical protein
VLKSNEARLPFTLEDSMFRSSLGVLVFAMVGSASALADDLGTVAPEILECQPPEMAFGEDTPIMRAPERQRKWQAMEKEPLALKPGLMLKYMEHAASELSWFLISTQISNAFQTKVVLAEGFSLK